MTDGGAVREEFPWQLSPIRCEEKRRQHKKKALAGSREGRISLGCESKIEPEFSGDELVKKQNASKRPVTLGWSNLDMKSGR
jgi:hypothetical protein